MSKVIQQKNREEAGKKVWEIIDLTSKKVVGKYRQKKTAVDELKKLNRHKKNFSLNRNKELRKY